MSSPSFDASGCLTPLGFAALLAAPPGRGPSELAQHLAGCRRCQERLLARGMPARKPSAGPPASAAGRLLRAALIVAGALLLALAALATLSRVTG